MYTCICPSSAENKTVPRDQEISSAVDALLSPAAPKSEDISEHSWARPPTIAPTSPNNSVVLMSTGLSSSKEGDLTMPKTESSLPPSKMFPLMNVDQQSTDSETRTTAYQPPSGTTEASVASNTTEERFISNSSNQTTPTFTSEPDQGKSKLLFC